MIPININGMLGSHFIGRSDGCGMVPSKNIPGRNSSGYGKLIPAWTKEIAP